MEREIVIYPNDVLRKQTKEIEAIDDSLFKLLEDMTRLMLEHNGVGIAAPQVGSSKRVCIVEVNEGEEPVVLINPRITEKQGEEVFLEGCLSIPGRFGTVARAETIVVEYFDIQEQKTVEAEASDFLARAIQHEVDHLDGILFIDKMIEEIPEDKLEDYYAQFEEQGES